MTEMHPDPIGDTGQKAGQYAQLVVMAAEAVAVIAAARTRAAAERDEAKAAQITAQLAANHKAAAALWEPVMADHKRDTLDVAQTLTAWAATQAWKETDPAADRASHLAEDRLHDLRPAAMMRYDDLRSQGLDPVTAMRQVVPRLDVDPRIGEPGRRAGSLAAATISEQVDDLDNLDPVRAADVDAGRLPDTAATRLLVDELDTERDSYEPPDGLSGSELTYGVNDRMADGPHQGWYGRAVDELHEELVAPTTAQESAGRDHWAETPARFDALRPAEVVAATALLVSESALLTEIEAHRAAAALEDRLGSTEQANARDPAATRDDQRTFLVDEHADPLAATGRYLSVVGDTSVHTAFERTAEQGLTASFPTAVTQVPAAPVTATANISAAAARAPTSAKRMPN